MLKDLHIIGAGKFLGWLLLLLSFPLLIAAGELQYAYSIEPTGVRTIRDHVRQFGNPQFVTRVKRTGDPSEFYELSGFPGGRAPLLALPSGPPAYVYDIAGLLVDWCADPGDTRQWRKSWKRVSTASLNEEAIVEQLGGWQ